MTARLRREIVEGEFDLGEALSESKIATRYKVSRTPVREAFARLGLEGLVRTEPQHGTFVFTMDRTQFAQMSEARAILEAAALRLAVERSPEELVARWTRLLDQMTIAIRAGKARHYARADAEFHETLFVLSMNPYLSAARQAFAAKIAAITSRLGARPSHMGKSYGEHVELLALVRQDDAPGALALLEHHIRNKGEAFWVECEATPNSRWQRISELAADPAD